jgi:hypothetical protein
VEFERSLNYYSPVLFLSIAVRACCGPSRYVKYNGFRLVIFDNPLRFLANVFGDVFGNFNWGLNLCDRC